MSEILVKEYRGNIAENIHRGSIAVVSSTGDTIAYLGDIEKQTFLRSASKPIQVLPTLLAGLHRRFNLTEEEVAMFNSSHWGSNHHIYVLEEISRKTGINPEDMIMKPCGSTSATALAAKLTDQTRLHPREGKSKLQHCCSGKHFSLMLLQRELTGKVDGYERKDSPVQKQIINFISMLSQTPTYKIGLGIDGCGVPVFALPLRSIAMSYAKLVDPFSLSTELRDTIDYNFSCIHKHPEKINDYGTPSFYVNQNPDLIMKDGSRGVICMAIRSMKLGIAVKLEDGWTDEFQGLIIANILEQLKYDDADLIQKLRNCYTTKLYNDCGIEVGHSESDFKLTIDPTFFEIPDEEPKDIPDTAAEKVSDSDSEATSSQPAPAPHNIDLFGDGEMVDANTGIDVRTENSQKAEKSLAAFDQKVASAADKVAKATEAADDDSIIDEIISREDEEDQTQTPEPSLSPEEQRALRNKKSILGMTVVKPSANKTFISNPLVDPIKTRHDGSPTEPMTPADNTTDTDSVVPGFIRQEIKSANIISQKKRGN
ncbi:MAG: asparaginase [Clostridiales bacterium]|nr:asparaginase [Clostridiales bacterium]